MKIHLLFDYIGLKANDVYSIPDFLYILLCFEGMGYNLGGMPSLVVSARSHEMAVLPRGETGGRTRD